MAITSIITPKYSVGDYVRRCDGRDCDKFFRIDKVTMKNGEPYYYLYNLEDNCPYTWMYEGRLQKVAL